MRTAKFKVLYHNDLDGECSGAIVHEYLKRSEALDGSEFVRVDYGVPLDDSTLDGYQVIMVDFSFDGVKRFDNFVLNVGVENITWIDHHNSAMTKRSKYPEIEGTVVEGGKAACELTWEYFFPGEEMPAAVKLVGDFDTWSFKYGEDTRDFHDGAGNQDTEPGSSFWQEILQIKDMNDVSARGNILTKTMYMGNIIKQWKKEHYRKYARDHAYITKWHGLRVVCCNAAMCGSLMFESIPKDMYDIMARFVYDGEKWITTLFTDNPDIDCSQYAEAYGGGGHPGAAGFHSNLMPFEVSDKTILREVI